MKKVLTAFLLVLLWVPLVRAQESAAPLDIPQDEYARATVVKVFESGKKTVDGNDNLYQIVQLRIDSGKESGLQVKIEHGGKFTLNETQLVKEGDRVVLVKSYGPDNFQYSIAEPYRLPALALLFALFLGLAIFFTGRGGVQSVIGLIFSVLVLIKGVVPAIGAGIAPLLACLGGAVLIAMVSLYLAHGFNRRTTVALIATLLTLGLAAVLAVAFVWAAGLTGLGSEDAFLLQLSPLESVSLKGLLLGGILIGTLGVLDDVTTAQCAALFELKDANAKLGFRELLRRGQAIGREHILSLVNTLALAYIGASLPLMLLFSQKNTQPLWLILNNENLVEEIIRTLVGSSALILAVPLSTFLAAYALTRHEKSHS